MPDDLATKANQVVMLNHACCSGGAVGTAFKDIRSEDADVAKLCPETMASAASGRG